MIPALARFVSEFRHQQSAVRFASAATFLKFPVSVFIIMTETDYGNGPSWEALYTFRVVDKEIQGGVIERLAEAGRA